MKKKLLAFALAAAVAVSAPLTAMAAWEKTEDAQWKWSENGTYSTDWDYIGDEWYYFDADGIMQTGWELVNGTWYYLNADGSMYTGWLVENGTTYYLNEGGDMRTGWFYYENEWYYFNKGGDMRTGWGYINNEWYYFNNYGVMQTGVLNIDGKVYAFEDTGEMITDEVTIGRKTYQISETGALEGRTSPEIDKYFVKTVEVDPPAEDDSDNGTGRHVHDYVYDSNNDGTHEKWCVGCGYSKDVSCSYETDKNDPHLKVCKDCGYKVTTKHNSDGIEKIDSDKHKIFCTVCKGNVEEETHTYGDDYECKCGDVGVDEGDDSAVEGNESTFAEDLAAGKHVILTENMELTTESTGYGVSDYVQNGGTLDGKDYTLSISASGDYAGIVTTGGTIQNLTIDKAFRAVFLQDLTADVKLDNVNIGGDGVGYAINTGTMKNGEYKLIVTNSTISGWTSFAGIESASFTDCEFGVGTYYNSWPYDSLVKPYVDTIFDGCEFAKDYYLDLSELGIDCTVILKNCTVNGTAVTADNCDELFGEIELPAGRTLDDCVIFVEGDVEIPEGATVVNAGKLTDAVKTEEYVLLVEDAAVAGSSGGYKVAGLAPAAGSTLDGGGNTLTVTGADGTWDCAIYTTGGTIKNLTVGGAFRGIFTAGCSADIVVDNVVIDNVCYTFSSDGSNPDYSVIFTNSTLNGWTSYTSGYKSVSFTDCKFGKGTGGYQYAYMRPYSSTTLTNCEFEEGFEFDATRTSVVFENCTVGGVALTQDNLSELLGADAASATVK